MSIYMWCIYKCVYIYKHIYIYIYIYKQDNRMECDQNAIFFFQQKNLFIFIVNLLYTYI